MAKLLGADWPTGEGFLIIEGRIIWRWLGASLQVVFSVTMVSRFAEVDENGIQYFMIYSENKNTRKSTNFIG